MKKILLALGFMLSGSQLYSLEESDYTSIATASATILIWIVTNAIKMHTKTAIASFNKENGEQFYYNKNDQFSSYSGFAFLAGGISRYRNKDEKELSIPLAMSTVFAVADLITEIISSFEVSVTLEKAKHFKKDIVAYVENRTISLNDIQTRLTPIDGESVKSADLLLTYHEHEKTVRITFLDESEKNQKIDDAKKIFCFELMNAKNN